MPLAVELNIAIGGGDHGPLHFYSRFEALSVAKWISIASEKEKESLSIHALALQIRPIDFHSVCESYSLKFAERSEDTLKTKIGLAQ